MMTRSSCGLSTILSTILSQLGQIVFHSLLRKTNQVYFVSAGPTVVVFQSYCGNQTRYILPQLGQVVFHSLLRKTDQVYFVAAGPTVVAFYSLLRKADQVYFAAAGPNRVP